MRTFGTLVLLCTLMSFIACIHAGNSQESLQERFEHVEEAVTGEEKQVGSDTPDSQFWLVQDSEFEDVEDGEALTGTGKLDADEQAKMVKDEEEHQESGFSVSTTTRGDVHTHADYVALDAEAAAGVRVEKEPTNEVTQDDPASLLQDKVPSILESLQHHAEANPDAAGKGFVLDHDDLDQEDVEAKDEETLEEVPESQMGVLTMPVATATKSGIRAGSRLSLETGFYRVVASLGSESGMSRFSCVRSSMLDNLEEGDVQTVIKGTPDMVQDATTGEVDELDSPANAQEELQRSLKRMAHLQMLLRQDGVLERRMKSVDEQLGSSDEVKELRGDAKAFLLTREHAVAADVAAELDEEVSDEDKDKIFGSLFRKLRSIARKVVHGISSVARATVAAFQRAYAYAQRSWGTLRKAMVALATSVTEAVRKVANKVVAGVKYVGGRYVMPLARRVAMSGFKVLRSAVAVTRRAFEAVGRAAHSAVRSMVNKAVSHVRAAVHKARAHAMRAVNAVKAGVQRAVSTVKSVVKFVSGLLQGNLSLEKDFARQARLTMVVRNRYVVDVRKRGGRFRVGLKDATIKMVPQFVLSIQVRKFRLKRLSAVLSGNLHMNLKMLAQLTGTFKHKKEKKVMRVRKKKVKFMLGALPVVILIKQWVFAGVNLNVNSKIELEMGGSLTAHLRVGVLYTGGRFRAIFKRHFRQQVQKPQGIKACAKISVELFLRPKIAFLLYTKAGPTFTLSPYMEMEYSPVGGVNACVRPLTRRVRYAKWRIYLGMRGHVGARVEVLGKKQFDKQVKLVEPRFVVLQGSIRLPSANVQDTGPTGANQEDVWDAMIRDEDYDPAELVREGDGGLSAREKHFRAAWHVVYSIMVGKWRTMAHWIHRRCWPNSSWYYRYSCMRHYYDEYFEKKADYDQIYRNLAYQDRKHNVHWRRYLSDRCMKSSTWSRRLACIRFLGDDYYNGKIAYLKLRRELYHIAHRSTADSIIRKVNRSQTTWTGIASKLGTELRPLRAEREWHLTASKFSRMDRSAFRRAKSVCYRLPWVKAAPCLLKKYDEATRLKMYNSTVQAIRSFAPDWANLTRQQCSARSNRVRCAAQYLKEGQARREFHRVYKLVSAHAVRQCMRRNSWVSRSHCIKSHVNVHAYQSQIRRIRAAMDRLGAGISATAWRKCGPASWRDAASCMQASLAMAQRKMGGVDAEARKKVKAEKAAYVRALQHGPEMQRLKTVEAHARRLLREALVAHYHMRRLPQEMQTAEMVKRSNATIDRMRRLVDQNEREIAKLIARAQDVQE